MQCPKCDCEMSVVNGYNVVENDDTPEKETKLYRVVQHKCLNKKCSNKDVYTQRIELELNKEEEEG